MRGHTLVVEPDDAYAARFPDFPPETQMRVECDSPDECGGWTECIQDHGAGNDVPWVSDEDAPWFEEEDYDFHGVTHTWRSGHGWTVPYKGCVVQEVDLDFGHLPIGRYAIEDEWDDTECYLTLISERES